MINNDDSNNNANEEKKINENIKFEIKKEIEEEIRKNENFKLIEIYSKEKSFSSLISTFIQIYNNKDLCPLLLKKFYEININTKEKNTNKIDGMDRNKNLQKYISNFSNISSEANNLIKSNNYDPIQFYGIILSYLNYYDYDNFLKYIDKLYNENTQILFEILLIYFSYFIVPIDKNIKFFNELIDYAISSNKDFYFFEKGLNLIKDIEICIIIINNLKEKIFYTYVRPHEKYFEPIKLKGNLTLKTEDKYKEMENYVIPAIKSIIFFSRDKKVLLIYLNSDFWINFLKYYNEPNIEKIIICYRLREILVYYKNLVNDLLKDSKNSNIKTDINKYFEKDEFAFFLNKNIRIFIENNKNLKNSEIIGYITEYNPYYQEDKFKQKREFYFFDYLNFDNNDDELFIPTFKNLNFEIIFKDNITEYLNKMFSKIQNISTFKTIIELISTKFFIEEKQYFEQLKEKYESIIGKEINSLTGEKLSDAIKIISYLADSIFIHEKNCNFIEEHIDKLDKKIVPLIYNELIRRCKGKEYEIMKEFIYEKFINNSEYFNSIIFLIDSLKIEDKIIFLKDIIKKCRFTKDEFFSCKENKKISLLFNLYERGILECDNKNIYEDLEIILYDIYKDIKGEICSTKLNDFLNNGEEKVIKKLILMKISYFDFEPEKEYWKLKKIFEDINGYINNLTYIKDSLIIFHYKYYQNEIKSISEIIRKLKNGKIKENISQEIRDKIEYLNKFKMISDQVNRVKDFLFFKVLYNSTNGKNQEEHFQISINKLENIKDLLKYKASIKEIYDEYEIIFEKIREILSLNELKIEKCIEQMIDYFNLDKKELINDLTILLKSKIYEMDLKKIIFFFECFEINDEYWNKKLSKKYEKLSEMSLNELKKNLRELKCNKIYDYQIKEHYYKLFNSLYEKKDAIDFLLSKTNDEINALLERIDPFNRIITLKNIQDTKECVNIFNKFKELNYNYKIFEYIKHLDYKQIDKFDSYLKIYFLIIELDTNYYLSFDFLREIKKIIEKATFIFHQDNEDFSYEDIEKKQITMEELILLKNKIYIEFPNNSKISNVELEIDCDKLIFFNNIISNLELIYEYMKILRRKGSSLPIHIKIQIRYPELEYYLNNKIISFEKIRDFLILVKTDYISQLDSIYKKNIFLRFLNGKQFRKIIRHLNGENINNLKDFLRFILNRTDNENVRDGIAINPQKTDDYVQQYHIYYDIYFENINNYLASLFQNNSTSIQNHYEAILLKDKNKFKGIYLYECENKSMKEFIIKIFWEKLGKLPIAQNILITSKETSSEEIQAFFNRAILCEYNTLFAIEINDSLSDFQQNIMYKYIDALLTYKFEIYKEMKGGIVDKIDIKEYLTSFIIFFYEKKNKDISILEDLKKLKLQILKDNDISLELEQNINNNNYKILPKFENIKVISSDFCGLGKSYKIKKMISDKGKKYFHFPLGGIVTKKIIFDELKNLLEKIEKIHEKNYQNIAIHLDLKESKEITIINEFLFSFLITKFFNDKANFIYIPKDIGIYIEIPNCFENYLSKFNILNLFSRENLSLKNMPILDLPDNIISLFNKYLEYNSNQKIETFIKKNIGLAKYSYHHVQIFIKVFLSIFNRKLIVDNEREKNITEEFIQEFCIGIKNFTIGVFNKLLMSKKDELTEKDYIDLLSNIENNLEDLIIPKILCQKSIFPDFSKKYKNSKDYLEAIKTILNLPNDVDKDMGDIKSLLSILEYKTDNYVITNDNFKKMILLFYRIKANIPVIIMGETGCGKTSLITKLNQILNNGEILLEIINIHPWISDNDIYEILKIINEKAEKAEKEIWVLFKEINTSLSLCSLNEIFINRTFNGEKLSEKIRLIGTYNPCKIKKSLTEKCYLKRDDDDVIDNELVYLVHPLPQSLLYYVFNFGLIKEEDEKQYIYNIIEKLFTKDEKDLHEITRDAIFECHKFLREIFDPSIISLREIKRFSKCVEFFQKYYSIINENESKIQNSEDVKLYKIKGIICSIYLCYYIRLSNKKRYYFNTRLRDILLRLVNAGLPEEKKDVEIDGSLIDQIKDKNLKNVMKKENIKYFSDFLKIEEEFLLDKIELDKDIVKNDSLKECIFLIFISVLTKIPLIITGKPGIGKSLSAELVFRSMKGKYSKEKFFTKFPQIITTYFKCSKSTAHEEIEKLFEISHNKNKNNINKEQSVVSLILFDNIDLVEKSENYPLKVLHSKLEHFLEDVSFVGITNYSLDAPKENRALNLLVPDFEDKIDQLKNSTICLVKSISEDLSNNNIFNILSLVYWKYKKTLKLIKELTALKIFFESKNPKENLKLLFAEIKNKIEFKNILKDEKKIKIDFHIIRDFYNFIKGIAIQMTKLINLDDEIEVTHILENYMERNFGGIEYEIDINLDLKLIDLEYEIKYIKEILSDFIFKKRNPKNDKIKVSSVFLFKKIFNIVCNNEKELSYIRNCNIIDTNKCINDNIHDFNNRHLLLEIEPSMAQIIYQNIRIQNPDKEIELYEGSSFEDDNKNEYKIKILNAIKNEAKSDKILILHNVNQIQTFLYDLYDNNFIIIDNQEYARIFLDSYKILIPVNNSFKIVIFEDKKDINKCDISFLSRFEKVKMSFDKSLNNEQQLLLKAIMEEMDFSHYIESYQINYELKDLLINCKTEEVGGLIYNFFIELHKKNNQVNENYIKERIYNKICKILPQDIICILPEKHIIKNYIMK